MPTNIVLTVLDEKKRPYMSTFESRESFHPRLGPNGALHNDERDFIIELARHATKTWVPVDSHRDPLGCVPFWIMETTWTQFESGPGDYYKFSFNPPLKIVHALPTIADPSR